MNEHDQTKEVDRVFDDRLTALLKQSAGTVPDLQRRTRRRIDIKVFQRKVITAAAAVAVVFVLATMWQVWLAPAPVPAVPDLSAAELDSLFAPPPVDPLTVLDHQQQVALHTLGRLESSR